jgi:hypothetical protein
MFEGRPFLAKPAEKAILEHGDHLAFLVILPEKTSQEQPTTNH